MGGDDLCLPAGKHCVLCAFCQHWGSVVPSAFLPALSSSPFRPGALQLQSDRLITRWFRLLPLGGYTCLRSS